MSGEIPKAMFHATDTRYNLSALPPQLDLDTRSRIEQQAQSVACLVNKDLFIPTFNHGTTQYHVSPKAPTLAHKLQDEFEASMKAHSPEEKRPPVQEEPRWKYDGPFKDELSIADGTAFLVGKQLILTAAHCVCDYISGTVNKAKITSYRVLFGFQTDPSGQVQTTFDAKDVYRIESVWQHRLTRDKPGDNHPTADWAILKLEREVEGRVPLSLTVTQALSLNTPLYMLGHPAGLPLKLTLSGQVQEAKKPHPHFFETDLDAYACNSGSPVFAHDTGRMVGMLLRGNQDYILRGKNIQVAQISKRMIEDGEAVYEKCHKIASIDFVKTVLSSSFKMAHSHFSGRTKHLADLKAHLTKPSPSTQVQILYGPSGVGKSELAIAFANQSIEDFSFIWSISCGTEEEQRDGYQDLAVRLAIPLEEKETLPSLIEKINRKLEQNGPKPWLLLLDNLQTSPVLPNKGGSVIITSYKKLSIPQGMAVATEVQPLEPEEALKLLQDVTGKQPEDCKKLLGHVGCYPLMLGQVAAYIKNTAMEVEEYLAILEQSAEQNASEPSRRTLEAAFGMTFKQLSPLTQKWLFLCSRLNAAIIPLSYLKAWLDLESSSENLAAILAELEEYGLLRYNAQEEVFSLHLEFQRILKAIAPSDTTMQVVGLLMATKKDWYFDNTSDWKKTMKKATIWASHAGPFVETVGPSFEDLDRASLLEKLGDWEYKSTHYEKARICHSEVLKIRRSFLGWDHPDIARSLIGIGNCYDSQGNYTEALKKYNQALEICRAVFGTNHPGVASGLTGIGNCYRSQGNYTEALKNHNQALEIYRAVFGKNHPDVAKGLIGISNCYRSQGNYTEALKNYNQALEICRAVFGKNHPNIAKGLIGIGACYESQGNYTEALKNYNQALEIRRAIFGENHPDVAKTLHNIERCQARLRVQQQKQQTKGRCIVS